MQIGIFAKTFARSSLGETLDAVKAHGIVCVQFNMSCAGLPTMPEEIPAELADRIRGEMDRRDLMMAAVSGTFNMIHPHREKRRAGLRPSDRAQRGFTDAARGSCHERRLAGQSQDFPFSASSCSRRMMWPLRRCAAGVQR